MKVVIAIDSLKGSMTSMEAGMAVKAGILAAKKDAEVIVKPLADGGEGTTDALIEGLKGERVDVTVTGPYHEPVQAYYGYLRESNTAVMEMATAAGITLSDKKEPMTATTYGVGELILHAIGRGIRDFIIGIGGSATNDGGVGMLRAFGYKFLDEKGEDVGEGGQALARIASVEISDKKELLSQCNFRIACDVTNPLCGSQGATYIYGPQKGVTPDILPVLEAGDRQGDQEDHDGGGLVKALLDLQTILEQKAAAQIEYQKNSNREQCGGVALDRALICVHRGPSSLIK